MPHCTALVNSKLLQPDMKRFGMSDLSDLPDRSDCACLLLLSFFCTFIHCSLDISEKNVVISDSVKDIGYSAFEDCISLSSITIPGSVTTIGSSAFGCCTSLASVIIPDSVTTIGKFAFSDCTSLASVTIPGSVTVDETGDKPKITFTTDNDNAGRWPSSNIKDYAARSLGDALSIPNGKSATFEYDYKVTKYGGDTDTSFAGLSFQRYTGNVKEMRSILVGKYKAAANGWGWDGGINIGSSGFYEYENAEYGVTVKENETYHVKIEVIKYDSYREYKVYINDKVKEGKYTVTLEKPFKDGALAKIKE